MLLDPIRGVEAIAGDGVLVIADGADAVARNGAMIVAARAASTSRGPSPTGT